MMAPEEFVAGVVIASSGVFILALTRWREGGTLIEK